MDTDSDVNKYEEPFMFVLTDLSFQET